MSAPIEAVIDTLVVRLLAVVAGKVEARMALEVGVVQQELLEAAREYREQGDEWGNAVASSLEAASERITREWMERFKLQPAMSLASGKSRQSQLGGELNHQTTKRSRGRPRKESDVENRGEQEESNLTGTIPH